jgi:hypothetical protein
MAKTKRTGRTMDFKNIALIIITLTHPHVFGSLKPKAGSRATTLVAPSGRLAIANSENDKATKEKIDKTVKQLKESAHHEWKERREIIIHAVVDDGIHPDALIDPHGNTPLYEALFERDMQDFDFARLLLSHGANLNRKSIASGLHLEKVKSVRMAQLLFDHGAHESVVNHGPRLLQYTVSRDNHQPELITWYVKHGADPNKYYEGSTPLYKAVFLHDGIPHKEAQMMERVALLMQAGALLRHVITIHWHKAKGSTIPQVIKRELEEAHRDWQNPNSALPEIPQKKIASLNAVRNIMIAFSQYRNKGLKADLLEVVSVPPLCDLIASYYIEAEPTYEELEAMPIPPAPQREYFVG